MYTYVTAEKSRFFPRFNPREIAVRAMCAVGNKDVAPRWCSTFYFSVQCACSAPLHPGFQAASASRADASRHLQPLVPRAGSIRESENSLHALEDRKRLHCHIHGRPHGRLLLGRGSCAKRAGSLLPPKDLKSHRSQALE